MRGSGHYGDSGGRAHPRGQMQHMSGQRMDHKPVNYYGRPDPLASDKEHSYASKGEAQWRWERDVSKAPTLMSPHLFNEGQGVDGTRLYYQGQRTEVKMGLERQGNSDPLSVSRGEDMDTGYKDNPLLHNFEDLEKKFLDDIMKLSKEQNDAEDAENARHREKINAINVKYEERLGALRARYAHQRDEFLLKESQAREKQYQKAIMDSYPESGMGSNDPHGYAYERGGNYNENQYDSYRERSRFLGNDATGHGFEQRRPYPGGRVYDTGSRYY